MNWDWALPLDQFWRSPAFPMWLTLGAAAFFGIVVLIMALRADKSVANGALVVITLLAITVASAVSIRGPGRGVSGETGATPAAVAALPALSCIDDMAGETVLTACEKALFGSAESAASALSYAAAQITRLTSFGDVASANKNLTPELQALRRSVERDRYGLMAYVLHVRDHCTPSECVAFRSLTNRQQLVSNMDERVYDGLVMRYSASWNMPAPAAAAASTPLAAFAPSMPTGKPTTAEFPTAASTPAVNIMTPEPSTPPPAPRAAASTANAPPPPARPPAAATAPAAAPPAVVAAKKQPPPKQRPSAPVQLSPSAPAEEAVPAAANE